MNGRGIIILITLLFLFKLSTATAASYASVSVPFNWIEASTHTKITDASALPARFYNVGGCGTAGGIGGIIDDTITDPITIGFNFNFAGQSFTTLRVMTNGRLQFGTNATCGYGTDNTGATIYTYDYSDSAMNYTMRIYGADLDPTAKSALATYPTTCLNYTSCYVSYATLGTAPYRRFVVTWNNIPEWVSGTQTSGNFNLQIILQENGEFIYQYGVNIHGSSGFAQVGWQVQHLYDYEVPQVNLPTNNSAIKFYIPRPVAEYRMEQPSWNGTANEVLDTSGNMRHASRLGSAQTTASGYVCRGGTIPLNTDTTINAIDTAINVPSVLGNAGTMTFWYKPTLWVGSSSDAQLFDATTINNEWFFLVKRRISNSTSTLRFVLRDSMGTDRIVETPNLTNSALNSGWVHIALSWNFNALAAANSDHIRIYVNGAAISSNSRETAFTSNGTLSSSINTLYIGDNRSSIIGSNGTLRSANGIIDEFRAYDFEGGIALVQRDMGQAITCVDHYAITHAGNAQACQNNNVTITAHTSNHTTIVMPNNTTMIQLNTNTGKGDWFLANGYGILDNGIADDGSATYLFNGEYQVILSLNHSTAGSVNINVTDGQIVESEDPLLVLSSCTSVAKFNACEYTAPRCDPATSDYDRLLTKLSNRAFKLDVLGLNSSNAVDTNFYNAVTIDLLANTSAVAVNPSTNCPAAQTAIIPLGTITFNAGRAPAPNYLTIAANAFSAITPNYNSYRDVRVRFSCNASNCPPSGMTVCSSDNFAVRPSTLAISSTMTNINPNSGTPKQVAGNPFTITAQAQDSANNNVTGYNGTPQIDGSLAGQKVTTHNGLSDYSDRLRDISDQVTVSFSAATPSTGNTTGTFYYLDYGAFRIMADGVLDNGYASVDDFTKDCVANSSSIIDSDADSNREKFGCLISNQTNTALFGRFYPSSFNLSSSSLLAACTASNVSYQGQAFTLNATVDAMTLGTYLTSRTMPSYSNATINYAAENANNGVDLSSRLTIAAGTWANGRYTLNTNSAVFSRASNPDNAFDALDIGIKVTDVDGALLTATDMNPTTAVVCSGAACTYKKLALTATKMRYGRIKLQNIYGSELLPLNLPLVAQYYNGSDYITNTLDNCTIIPASSMMMTNYANNLNACDTQLSPTANLTLVAGVSNFTLSSPNLINTGSVDMTLNLTAVAANTICLSTVETPATAANLPWFGTNPTARATFGIYSGHSINRQIYFRELY